MPNTDPVVDSAPVLRSLRDAAVRDARVPVGFIASITNGLRGEELTEMAELRDEGAVGFTDDGRPVVSRRDDAQGAAVPAPVPAACSRCTRRTRRSAAAGRCTRARSARCSASPASRASASRRWSRATRARRLRERAHPHPAPLAARSRSRSSRRPRRPACRSPCEASPHHLCLTDARGPRPRHAHEDEPAAAHRGRPPGADRGPALGRRRLHRHRPRAARARREGGALRAGADGHDRPGDRVRRGLHRARASRACSISPR